MTTMFSPALLLGRNTIYASTVLNGDIDTAAKLSRLNAAMNEPAIQTFVFDRSYNITSRDVSASSALFTPKSGLNIIGDHNAPLDMSMMANSGSPRYLYRASGAAGVAQALGADLAQGSSTINMDPAKLSALDLRAGDRVSIRSDKVFVGGGIITLVFTGSVSVNVGETIEQADSSATGVVFRVTSGNGQTRVGVRATGVFTQTGLVSASVSGDLGTPVLIVNPVAQGEIATVVSIGSSAIVIQPPAQDNYSVTEGAVIQKLNLLRGLRFEGIRGISCGQFSSDTIGDRFLHLVWADAPELIDCRSEFFDNGSYIYSSPDVRAIGWRAEFQPKNGRDANQYGLCLVNACQDALVQDWTVINGKHAIVQSESDIAQGVTRRMTVRDGLAAGQWNFALAAHTNAEQISFDKNRINGASGGIDARCRGVTTRDNEIRFLPYANIGVGIQVSEVPEDYRSRGDRVFGGRFALRCDMQAVPSLSGSTGPRNIDIHDFHAERFSDAGIRIFGHTLTGLKDFTLSRIRTREAGHSSAEVGAAPSIWIGGDISDFVIDGYDLRAASGNTSAAILTTSATSNGVVMNGVYQGHSEPSLSGTNVHGANGTAI